MAANQLAYWKDKSQYIVTNDVTQANAANMAGVAWANSGFRNYVAGIFRSAVTAGRYCDILQRGRNISVSEARPPEKRDDNRGGFGGIENGLHQRLDVSHNDDRCRIRHTCGMFVAGLLRRISNSLFMEWRSHQPHPEHLTTTDFQAAMGEDHCRPAMRLMFAKRPSLKPP